jgi:hypothetical protein
MDSISYGYMANVALSCSGMLPRGGISGEGDPAMLVVDQTIGGLSPQQLTFVNMTIFGHQQADVGISIVPDGGGGSQGSNITFLNPFIGTCNRAGLRINGNNALNIDMISGDVQNCQYDGIQQLSGSMNAIGCSFENQLSDFFTSPQRTQLANMGRDILANGPGGVANASYVANIRSEANIGVYSDTGPGVYVANYGVQQVDLSNPGYNPSSNYQLGDCIVPDTNNTKGRAFMCVDTGGESIWRQCDDAGSSGDIIAVKGSPGWTVNQWVGFKLRFRFGSNGFTSNPGLITSNTANTITLAGSGLGNSARDDSMILIQGVTGGSPPNWDAATDGNYVPPGASGQGFFANVGTSTVNVGPAIYGGVSVGDYILVRDATLVGCFNGVFPQFPFPLISKVLTKTGGTTLTVTQPVYFGNSSGFGTDGYFGTAVVDGAVRWLELPFAAFQGCKPLVHANCGSGIVRNCQHVEMLECKRTDAIQISNISLNNPVANESVNLSGGPNYEQLQTTLPISSPLDLTKYTFATDVLSFLTSGITSFTITFGTNALSTGTLATGAVSGKRFVVRFVSDGAKWIEILRTGAL